MKKIIGFAVLSLSIVLTGCTGVRSSVRPDSSTLQAKYNQKFVGIGLKDVPGDRLYPPAGRITDSFARDLEVCGIAKNVYYPARPDDPTELVLESKFDIAMDPHMGPSMAKAFCTGLTLFILEPLFWYNFDYNLTANVDLIKNGQRYKSITARTDADMGMKWLSLSKAVTLEADTLKNAKESLSRQIIQKLAEEK